jgi:hypothetical protein
MLVKGIDMDQTRVTAVISTIVFTTMFLFIFVPVIKLGIKQWRWKRNTVAYLRENGRRYVAEEWKIEPVRKYAKNHPFLQDGVPYFPVLNSAGKDSGQFVIAQRVESGGLREGEIPRAQKVYELDDRDRLREYIIAYI